MAYKKRNDNTQTIKDVLQEMISSYHLDEELLQTRAKECWIKLLGDHFKPYTDYVILKNGKLYVKINAASIKNELLFAREKLRNKVNKEMGSEVIQEIILR